MRKPLILFVGMVDSSHFQSWISAVGTLNLFRKIHVFPSDRPRNVSISRVSYRTKISTKLSIFGFPFTGFLNFSLYWFLDQVFGLKWRSLLLDLYIRVLDPDYIHFHETQHGAYIFNGVSQKTKEHRSHKILSTWGSDFILFSKIASEKTKLFEVLSWVDTITAEREVEHGIIKSLGFNGRFEAPVYISVGAPNRIEKFNQAKRRKKILVKGTQNFSGRALNALASLEAIHTELNDYEINIFSQTADVAIEAECLAERTGLKIKFIPKLTNHEDFLEYFKKSRVYIGLGISDGLSTSMAEAMTYGAIPIQSRNSAAEIFIEDGISGFVVDPWDIEGISNAILKSISDDEFYENASAINSLKVLTNYNYSVGIAKIRELYL